MDGWLPHLRKALACGGQLVDPLRMGWLEWADASATPVGLHGLPWLLWGLVAPDLLPASP